MKVHKVTLMVIDFDNIGSDGVEGVLETTRYANRCINPKIVDVESVDIGEWDDKNPLNSIKNWKKEYYRLFCPSYKFD
jgi:hypothetical protein